MLPHPASSRTSFRSALAAALAPWLAPVLLCGAGACGSGSAGEVGGAEPVPDARPARARHADQVDVEGLLAEDRAPSLTILYTATVQGFIEPCGCVAGQIGGIDRLVGYVEDELARNPNAVFVDGGDLFCRNTKLEPNQLEQLPYKAEAFFEVWGALGCAGLSLGENDLSVGVPKLLELSERYHVPILCANVVDEDGEPVFEDSVIVERGGRRIGLFGLLAPDLLETEVEGKGHDPENVKVAPLVHQAGYRLASWRATAKDIVQRLSSECDLVVCVSHLGYDVGRLLAGCEPDVDLVFGGHWESSKETNNFVKNTPLLVSLSKGSRVGKIDLWLGDEEAYFRPQGHGRLKDVSERASARYGAVIESLSLIDMQGREAAYEGDLYEIELHNHRVEREDYLAEVAALPPLPAGNLFSHYLVPMSAQFRRSERALDAVDRYHERAHEHWTSTAGGKRDIEDSKRFVGPAACVDCHPQQYEFWLATRHSHAIDALAATQQDTDPECIGCHTVGYHEEGGFNQPGRYEDFASVQCAACHGPGGPHVQGGASYLDRGLIVGNGLLGCAKCHEKEHDPPFEERSALKLIAVACPPIEPPGEGNANLRFAYRQGARLLESVLEDVPWPVVADAYLRAGDVADSIAAAENWVAESPKSPAANFAVADRYLLVGRTKESERIYRKLVRRNPESANGWIGLGRSILERDPEAAATAGLEAFSLAPGRVEAIRLVAEGGIGAGHVADAADAVAAFLERQPEGREELADVLERLAAAGHPVR